MEDDNMKKLISKFMAAFLFCTCFLFMGITQKANAAIDNTYNWGFGIFAVYDGQTEDELSATPMGSKDYILKSNSVIVFNAYVLMFMVIVMLELMVIMLECQLMHILIM